jgi:NADPH-ferrihemoprotein reductase
LLNGKFGFAVLGVGDSNLLLDRQTTTAKDCNQVAQELDARLQALGGRRHFELGLSDERTGMEEVEPWIDGFWKSLE